MRIFRFQLYQRRSTNNSEARYDIANTLPLGRWGNRKSPERESARWDWAVVTVLIATSLLAVYPEQLIHRTGTHILTIVIGAFVLFFSMRLLITALLPYRDDEEVRLATPRSSRGLSGWRMWAGVVALGLSVGGFAFVGEISEGAGPMPLVRVLLVASVFVGLGLAGIVIAYLLLAAPLGLRSR